MVKPTKVYQRIHVRGLRQIRRELKSIWILSFTEYQLISSMPFGNCYIHSLKLLIPLLWVTILDIVNFTPKRISDMYAYD